MSDLEQLITSAIWRWGEEQDRQTSAEENQAHELQERLWCLGPLGDGTEQSAFGVIEHIGGSFETEDPEFGVEHLGKAMCCAAVHSYIHGLAIAPILALARTFTRRSDVHPVHGATRLAALERADDPGPAQIVEALAMCVAKGIDDCEIVHGLVIEPLGLFLVVGKEVIAAADKRFKIGQLDADLKAGKIKLPDGWTHENLPPSEPDDRVDAMAYGVAGMDRAAQAAATSESRVRWRAAMAKPFAPVVFAPRDRSAGPVLLLDSALAAPPAKGPGKVPDDGPGAFAFPRDRVKLERSFPRREQLSALTRLTEDAGGYAEPVNPRGICPQCAAPMSPLGDTGYRCELGHELTSEQMTALLRGHADTAPDGEP